MQLGDPVQTDLVQKGAVFTAEVLERALARLDGDPCVVARHAAESENDRTGIIPSDQVRSIYESLAALMAAGKMQQPVAAEYPLSEITAALRHASTAARGGKVLLRIGGDFTQRIRRGDGLLHFSCDHEGGE